MANTLKQFLLQLAADKRVRYLMVGGSNTLVGYLVSLALYYSLSKYMHIVFIGIIANIICITFSFLTYKLFVFRTKGNWLAEYLRCYIVYSGSAAAGIAGIWLLVDVFTIPFWLAQGSLMVVLAFASYIAHSRFSFSTKGLDKKSSPPSHENGQA